MLAPDELANARVRVILRSVFRGEYARKIEPGDCVSTQSRLEPGKNLIGHGRIAGNFENLGSVVGNSPATEERIVFGADWLDNDAGSQEYWQEVARECRDAAGDAPQVI
jgi:hypothetical protein